MMGYMAAMVAIIIAIPPTYFLISPNAAWVLSFGGTLSVTFGTMAYIVFWHSRKRRPGVGVFERFSRVISFYRGR